MLDMAMSCNPPLKSVRIEEGELGDENCNLYLKRVRTKEGKKGAPRFLTYFISVGTFEILTGWVGCIATLECRVVCECEWEGEGGV